MSIDTELLERALKRITDDPDHWDQTTFVLPGAVNEVITVKEGMDLNVCGTTHCLAGHILMEAGYTLRAGDAGYGMDIVFERPDGAPMHGQGLAVEAGNLIGITRSQGYALFLGWDATAAEDPETFVQWVRDYLEASDE